MTLEWQAFWVKTDEFHVTASPNSISYSGFSSIFSSGRIVGGDDARIEDNPWQVSIQVGGRHHCGGTIVSKEWVLTAAHCTNYISVCFITIKAGTSFKNQGGSSHQATVIKHENYHTNRYEVPVNDVALIRVDQSFELDETCRSTTLFDHQEEALDGILSVITGWGTVREGGSTSERLQTIEVPIVSKKVCSDAYKSYGGIPEGQICAAHPKGGRDACQGDSGGPLTVGGRLAGIVSRGNSCSRPGYPGVYTEIATYRNWIADKADI